MKIGPVLDWTKDGVATSREDANEVFIHVDFPGIEGNGYSILFNLVTKQAKILDEGFDSDWKLSVDEYKELVDYMYDNFQII